MAAGNSWAKLHSDYDDLLEPMAWDADMHQTRDTLATVGRKFWRLVSPEYRRAKRHLSSLCSTELSGNVERWIAIAEAILEEQELRKTIERISPVAGAMLGPKWRGTESDWEAISRIVGWVLSLLDDVDSGKIPLDVVRSLRDDIDAVRIRDLLSQTRTASDTHTKRAGALQSIFNVDIENNLQGTDGLLTLLYVEQRDVISKWSRENSQIQQANRHLSSLHYTELPSGVERQIEVIEAITEEQELRKTIEQLAPVADAALGQLWRGEQTDWNVAKPIINWMLNLYDDIDSGRADPGIVGSLGDGLDTSAIPELSTRVTDALESHIDCLESVQDSLDMDVRKRFGHPKGLAGLPLEEQQETLVKWSSQVHDIQDIAVVNNALMSAKKEGLHAITKLAEEWPAAADRLTTCLEKTWYERIVSRAFGERPALTGFDGSSYEAHREQFRKMDTLVLDHNRARVAHAHWEGLPKHTGAGQLRILRREFEKKRRHLAIRQLMEQAGNAIQAIKPVFMMSPLSIATYLAPGSVNFDLVVFDEASQVRPVDAIGALLRADQTVVVGDDRQLPPTSFFDAVTHAEDDGDDTYSDTADIESILGLLRTAGCPARMLRWHYRSRHESLIAVSNQEFYENRLVVFPSPDSGKETIGLQYHHLPDTVYDRGRSSTNRQEAQAVANAVMDHARKFSDLTLGVAAFSSAQERAILDELEMLRRRDTSCESFFNDHPEEPFFVKNLENVQGDEREVIFISVGYGRDANGHVTMNFGPLNRDGGERRLNVIDHPGTAALPRVHQSPRRGHQSRQYPLRWCACLQDLPGLCRIRQLARKHAGGGGAGGRFALPASGCIQAPRLGL